MKHTLHLSLIAFLAVTACRGDTPAGQPALPATEQQDTASHRLEASGAKLRELRASGAMKSAQVHMIETTYGELFRKFGFDAAKGQQFWQLLNERQEKETDIMMAPLPPNLPAAQLGALVKDKGAQTTAVRTEYDTKIKELLNNEKDYQTYAHWEDTKSERLYLRLALPAFNTAGSPLSDQQQGQLIDLMAAVRKPPQPPAAKSPPGTPLPGGRAAYAARQAENNLKVLKQAAAFLSPVQLEALKRSQEQRQASLEAQAQKTAAAAAVK